MALSRYRILRQTGEGGFGKVYLVEDPSKNLFCLKEFISNDSLLRELQLILRSNFNSSYLVKYHSHFSEMEKTYILMEYCENGSLADFIERQTSYPSEKVVLEMFAQIVEGISTLHNNGFIHRDIKPSNILITRNQELKLADFGTLKNISQGTISVTFTMGTMGFIPKEEMEGCKPTTASDIFAAGCTIYNLMARVRPFNAPTAFGVPQLVLEGRYSPLTGPYSSALKELVYSMMNKDLNARPSLAAIRTHPLLASVLARLPQRARVAVPMPSVPAVSLLSLHNVEASTATASACAACHASTAAQTEAPPHAGWCMSPCTCSRGHLVCAACLLKAARMAAKLGSRGVVACPVDVCEDGTFAAADVAQRIPGDVYVRLYGSGGESGGGGGGFQTSSSKSSPSSSPSTPSSQLSASHAQSSSSRHFSSSPSSSHSFLPSPFSQPSSSSSSPTQSSLPSSFRSPLSSPFSQPFSSSSSPPLLETDDIALSAKIQNKSPFELSILLHHMQENSSQQRGNPLFSALLTRLSVPPKPYFFTGPMMQAFRIALNQDKCFLAVVCVERQLNCNGFLRRVLCTPVVGAAVSSLRLNVWGCAFSDSYERPRALRRVLPGLILLGSLNGKIKVINFWELPVGDGDQMDSADFLNQLRDSVADYEACKGVFVAAGGNPCDFRDSFSSQSGF